MSSTTLPGTSGGPSWALLGFEPLRAAFEYASMRFMNKAAMPAGDGHPVVIFPGLASDERAVGPLRSFCAELGYSAYDWGRGFNTGPAGDAEAWLDELALHVRQLTAAHERRVSLVGWSLGGIYAREVAKRLTGSVRQVITIGTPFAASAAPLPVGLVYRLVNGSRAMVDDALALRLKTAPDVPTTSIYSRSDGIVSWQACLQAGDQAHTENIEVTGSHCGLGWNPAVLAIVADRLRQAEGAWQRYS